MILTEPVTLVPSTQKEISISLLTCGLFNHWRALNPDALDLFYSPADQNSSQRYYLWKARQRECQSELWTDPKGYYFCNIVTVLPSEQGKGIGKALFEKITKQADKEGVKC